MINWDNHPLKILAEEMTLIPNNIWRKYQYSIPDINIPMRVDLEECDE